MRANAVRFLMGLCALTVVSACTPKDDATVARNGEPTTSVLTVPAADADQVAASGELSCNFSGGVCPSALALMSSRTNGSNETRFMQCTSFLVGRDLIATNSHCLPAELRHAGAFCNGRIKFYFGASDSRPTEIADGAIVVAASAVTDQPSDDTYLKTADFALIRLARSLNRQALEISREGLPDRFELKILTVDPDLSSTQIRGVATAKTCVTNEFTVVTPQYTNEFANLATATCLINKGNSGSPALDLEGRVRAVVQGTRPKERAFRNRFSGVDLPTAFNDVAVLTNASCFDSNGALPLGPLSDQCQRVAPDQNDLMRQVQAATSSNFDSLYQDWKRAKPFGFDLYSVAQHGRTYGFPYLKCLPVSTARRLATGDSLAGVDRIERVAPIGSRYRLEFRTPYWGVRAVLDSDYRIGAATRLVSEHVTRLTLDLDGFNANGFAKVRKTETDESGLASDTGDFDLLACP